MDDLGHQSPINAGNQVHSEPVASDELKELLKRLQTKHQGGATVGDVAEAAGCSPEEVKRELDRMRAEESFPAVPAYTYIHDTTINDGYIETVEYKRTRTPVAVSYVGAAIVIAFLIFWANAACDMKRHFDEFPNFGSSASSNSDFKVWDGNGKEITDPNVRSMIHESTSKSRFSPPR